jgi:hypothetical protein
MNILPIKMDVQHPSLFQTATHERRFQEFSSVLEIIELIRSVTWSAFHLQRQTGQIEWNAKLFEIGLV